MWDENISGHAWMDRPRPGLILTSFLHHEWDNTQPDFPKTKQTSGGSTTDPRHPRRSSFCRGVRGRHALTPPTLAGFDETFRHKWIARLTPEDHPDTQGPAELCTRQTQNKNINRKTFQYRPDKIQILFVRLFQSRSDGRYEDHPENVFQPHTQIPSRLV